MRDKVARAARRRRGAGGRGPRPHLQAGHQHAPALGRGRAVRAGCAGRGVEVRAHDPTGHRAARETGAFRVRLCRDPGEALAGADVAVVATPWPDYRELSAEDFLRSMRRPRVVDRGVVPGRPRWPETDASLTWHRDGRPAHERATREERSVELAGRAAIITGASQGLGRAIAARLRRGTGPSVLLVARDGAGSRAAPGRSLPRSPGIGGRQSTPCRATSRARRAARQSWPRLGPCCLRSRSWSTTPASTGRSDAIEEVDWSRWVQAIEINLFGTVLMCRAVIPLMRGARLRQDRQPLRRRRHRAAAPLQRLRRRRRRRSCGSRRRSPRSCATTGVDVNAIAPGALNTRLLDEVLAAGPEKVGRRLLRASR